EIPKWKFQKKRPAEHYLLLAWEHRNFQLRIMLPSLTFDRQSYYQKHYKGFEKYYQPIVAEKSAVRLFGAFLLSFLTSSFLGDKFCNCRTQRKSKRNRHNNRDNSIYT